VRRSRFPCFGAAPGRPDHNPLTRTLNETIPYTASEIAKIAGGRLVHSSPEAPDPSLISIDSRQISDAAATLFFAIRTRHQDGNRFVHALHARGVRNFVITDRHLEPGKLTASNVILVKDSVAALQRIAAHHRRLFPGLEVIGITGSNGKTIVKEWLNQLLSPDYAIVRSPQSYNSQIGVPLSVLQIDASHNLGIFEAGISQPGEMKALEEMIRPSIGILTNIGEAHDEGFKDKLQKTREKLQLFTHCRHLVYRADEAGVRASVRAFREECGKTGKRPFLFSWGTASGNRLRILSVRKSGSLTRIRVLYREQPLQIAIPFTDGASIENALHCLCVLLLLGKGARNLLRRFELLYPVAMRLEQRAGINHSTVINDSYSNDLHSLSVAIAFLEQQKQHRRHTIILSDILQSGRKPPQLYAAVAALFRKREKIRLIGIGPEISSQRALLSFSPENEFFDSVEAFFGELPRLRFHDETILIKGARRFGFEEISHRLEQQLHQTILSINLNAIAHNLKQYRALLRPQTRVMAMVKAFSYGSGGHEIASVLEYNKVDYLAVAYTDEGVELRKAGITVPIMVMNAEPESFAAMVEHRLEPEIFSFGILRDFEHYLETAGARNYPVHLKIDTGMHRLGFTLRDAGRLADAIRNNARISVVSVFSHLVASEDPREDAFTRRQYAIFKKCCDQVESAAGVPVIRHIANTAAITRHPGMQLDMVRLGIGLYGIDPDADMQRKLRNVTTLTTTISQIKKVRSGQSVGYGRKARLKRDSIIATVRIGYADGYPRILGNGNGKMLLHGKKVAVTGNVCMDMTMLDVTDVEDVKEGSEVTVFGEGLPLAQLAQWAQTIPYEIMTGISRRVKRVYFEE